MDKFSQVYCFCSFPPHIFGGNAATRVSWVMCTSFLRFAGGAPRIYICCQVKYIGEAMGTFSQVTASAPLPLTYLRAMQCGNKGFLGHVHKFSAGAPFSVLRYLKATPNRASSRFFLCLIIWPN